MPSVVACQLPGFGRNIVPGNLRSGTRAATQKGRSHDTASALGVYEPQLPIRTMHCATAHHVPKAVARRGYRRGVGRCQRGRSQRRSNGSDRPADKAGRFVAAQVAVVRGSLRSGQTVSGENRVHDHFAARALQRDRSPAGRRSGSACACADGAGADHSRIGRFQPAVVATDRAADADAHAHSDANPHAASDPHARRCADCTGDADAPRDPASESDGRADATADCNDGPGHSAGADRDPDPDESFAGNDRSPARRCAERRSARARGPVIIQQLGRVDRCGRGSGCAHGGHRLVASPT